MRGTFIWNELLTFDLETAKAYYAALAGWTYEAHPMPQGGTYWVASAGGRPCAGLMSLESLPAGSSPHWFAYLCVDDIAAACATVVSQGGQVSKSPWLIPGVGTIAVVVDSTGACVGLMQPASD